LEANEATQISEQASTHGIRTHNAIKALHLDHLFGAFSTINPDVVKNIQIYKSSYNASYGGRSSGVLDITGRSGDKGRESLSISADLISLGVVAETPLIEDKMSLLFSVRRSMSDIWNTGLYDELFNTVFNESTGSLPNVDIERRDVNPEFYFYDVNAKLDLDLADGDGLSLSFFQGADVYTNNVHNQYIDNTGPEPKQLNDYINDDADWGNTGAGLVWRKKWTSRTRSFTSIGMSDYKSDYFFSRREEDFSVQGNDFSYDSDLQRNELLDITFKHALFAKSRGQKELELGYQFTHHRLSYSDYVFAPFDNSNIQDSLVSSNTHTVYANRKRNIGNSSEVTYGGRLSVNSYTDRLYLEPRFSFIHRFSESLSASFALGNYIQMVRRLAEQDVILKQPDLWVLSDGDEFEEIRSFQLTTGLKWKKSGWNIDMEPYFKNIEGTMIDLSQTRLLTALDGRQPSNFLTGNTQIIGLDLFVQRTFKRHSGWLGYSYSYSQNRFNEVNDGLAFPSPFNKLHDLKGVYTYKIQDWEIGSTAISSTGFSYTPLLGTFYNSITNDYFIQYGDDFSARLPSYFRWDVNVARSFHWKDVDMTMSAGVYNLTDKVNIRERDYLLNQVRLEPGEDLVISESDLELLGIRPNFSIRITLK
jgi:hypothetical protein